MNKFWMLACLCLASLSVKAQATIADARTFAIGQTVTIKGVVTNGSELGPIRYVQDATGALPGYGSNLNGVVRGDSVTITGELLDFNGLLEISPVTSFTNHGPVTMPAPMQVPLSAITESLESRLVRVDNVTFTTTGSFASGNSTVQITDGTTTLDVRINGTTNIDGTAIPTGPVSIVALVGQFNANYQLVPRALADITAYVPPAREINVKIGGNTYLTGSQYAVGTTASTAITIENTGSGNLTVSGASFSGANAAEFTTPFTNAVIAGGATSTLTLNFAPVGPGSRLAALTIASDDADESSYVINLYGIGTNNLATEPAASPTNLNFSNVKAYAFNGSFTASANTEKYLVVYTKNGAPVSGAPVDGTTYQKGDVVGNGQVLYVGSAVNFTPRHIIANQNYHIAVFSFNGPATFENYKTTAPLTGNVTSQGQQIGNYYNSINSSNTSFLTSLSALINPHTVITYANYKSTVMAQFEIRDTTQGKSFVVCSYTGEKKVFDEPFDWTTVGYSREHTFSHSWMPSYPADGTPAKPEYSDQHNLYPVNQNQANSPRSNHPMGIVTGTVLHSYQGGKTGYNGSQIVYEPRNEQKGNAARAMFYMATAYNGIAGQTWSLPTGQDQEILKIWHLADQPDNYEIARNEYIFSQQGNRNPYVDSVQFACYVSFSNMSYIATGCGDLGVNEQLLQRNLVLFPVPATTDLYVQVNGTQVLSYKIVSLSGQVIEKNANLTLDVLKLNTSDFKAGTYLIEVETPYGKANQTFIVE
ncbi:Extracellular ribonuclease precursor [compost metagenome]